MRKSGFAVCALVALLAFPAGAEEIPDSGCDPGMYDPFCFADIGTSILFCQVDSGVGPEAKRVSGVRMAIYELVAETEIAVCVTGGRYDHCEVRIPRNLWFILELEAPCGNGKLFWRNISHLGSDKFENRSYSSGALEELGVLNDETLLAMARFVLLAVAEAPCPR